jgi:hypothetical protein
MPSGRDAVRPLTELSVLFVEESGGKHSAKTRSPSRCVLPEIRYFVDVSYQPMALAGMARFVADYEIDAA